MKFDRTNEKRETLDIRRKLFNWKEKNVKEKKLKVESPEHTELYERLVEEAVLLISAVWEETARYIELGMDKPLKAQDVFFITKDELKLFADYGFKVENPKTKRCCFFDSFTFESMEEVEKYIEDIKSRLSENTVVVCKEKIPPISETFGPSLFYSFEIDVKK